MHRLRRHRDVMAYGAAVVFPLGIAAVLVPFRSSFADSASAVVLVAAILAVAAFGNRAAGLLATISATAWFDFLLTRPYERFAISHRPDVETAVSLLVVGVVVTELAARSRRYHQAATERLDYVGLIHDFSELVASGLPAELVIERARRELAELLHLRDCRFEPVAAGRTVALLEHDGRVTVGGMVWNVDLLGLPDPELTLLVQSRGSIRARFVMSPANSDPVSIQRRVVAVAIADQVGAALPSQRRSA
jgi:K+-sensing histidine kinase KdpD